MKKHLPRFIAFAFVLCAAAPFTCLGDEIPKTAWRRPLGQPLDHPGVRKNNVDIDDGYWQGAPVGGFGAGTFSRTYRGDFARWHIKTAVHKYETVFANQFAMFQKADGDSEGTASSEFKGRRLWRNCVAEMKPRPTQFGVHENAASSGQHASRLAVSPSFHTSRTVSLAQPQENPSVLSEEYALTVREAAKYLGVSPQSVYLLGRA